MSIRFRRILAFIIDWNLSLLPVVLIVGMIMPDIQYPSVSDVLIIFLFIGLMFAGLAAFVLRDVIFNGRSVGKRIVGLAVYDKFTGQKATVKQCFLRNVFFMIYAVDGILLLATGETIGDRVANTVVYYAAAYDTHIYPPDSYAPPTTDEKR